MKLLQVVGVSLYLTNPMKSRILHITIGLFLTVSIHHATAQQDQNSSLQIVQSDTLLDSFIQQQQVSPTIPIISNQAIQQINILQSGNENQLLASMNGNNNVLEAKQFGNGNFGSFDISGNNATEIILQNGSDNFFHNYSLLTTLNPTTFQVVQNGEGNTIDKFGSNSITDGMTIIQTGNDMSLIIISF